MDFEFLDSEDVKPKNRFVLFLDILGFTSIINEKSIKEVYDLMAWPIKTAISDIKSYDGALQDFGSGEGLTPFIFSDSILIFTNGDTKEDLLALINVAPVITARLINHGVPVKGAIACGETIVEKDNSIFLGKPIIDAYNLESQVKYLGVVLHHTVNNFIFHLDDEDKIYVEDRIKEEIFFGRVNIGSSKIEHSCIDWFALSAILSKESSEKEKYTAVKDLLRFFYTTSSGSTRLYYQNTIDVLEDYVKIKDVL